LRTTKANADRVNLSGALPAISTRRLRPNGAMLLGFFLKPNRFAYGEKFFTAPGER